MAFLVCSALCAAGVQVATASHGQIELGGESAGSTPLFIASDLLTVPGVQQLDGGQEIADQALVERSVPEAVEARERSRTAYRHLGSAAAARVVREDLPKVVATAPSGLGRVPAGVHIVRYLSSTAAQVTLPGGKHGMVESLTPIATLREGGRYAPVDLELRQTSSGYTPSRSDAPVSIPKSLEDGAALPVSNISLTPVDVSGRPLRGTGQLDGSTVLYPNSETDTDTAIKATSSGFETYDVLRSTRSPDELSFKIETPRGARVIPAGGNSGAVRVVEGGRTVALLPAPEASDASGVPVPVSARLSGQILHLNVAHRSGDFAYPIAVDPTVIDSELTGGLTSALSNWRLEKGGPEEGHNFGGYDEYSAGWMIYTDPTHQTNQWGSLLYPTQGESHIYQVSMETSAADSTADVENHIAIFGKKGAEEPTWEARKLMGTSYARTGSSLCVGVHCSSSEGGSAGNVAGYWVNAIGTGAGGEVRIYTASVYLAQTNGPTASFDTTDATLGPGVPNVLYGGGTWWGPVRGELKAIGKDPGVGVREMIYEVGSEKWTAKPFSECVVECPENEEQFNGFTTTGNGGHKRPPDGEPTMVVKAVNGMGTVSSAVSTKVKVDGTAPYEVTVSGLPSGNSITDANRTVKIVAKAKDGSGTVPSSGIGSFTLSIDGKEVGSPSGSCSPGPCTATGEWTISGEDYAAGSHTLVVTAIDGVGNKATAETTFTVHHAAPIATGPGQLNPVSGEFDLEETDVSVPTSNTPLRVTRAFDSSEPQSGAGGPLGSPWSISFGGAQSIVELPNGSALLTDVGGHRSVFTNTGGGHYASPVGDSALVLTKSGSEFKLADKGTTIGFTHTSGDVEGLFRPVISTDTGGTSSTLYTYQVVGGVTEPLEALAPVPTGVSCAPELKPGCRALTFNYAGSTTATGEAPSQWGDYTGHLTRVNFTAYDTVSKSMKTASIAQYSYDSKGRMRAVWDPRISPALKATYGYDAEGHVTSISPPGEEAWIFRYGTTAADATAGRLVSLYHPPASTAIGSGVAPAKVTVPKLLGSPVIGIRMTASDGTWSESPLSYAYQWEDCSAAGTECKAIPGAINASYTPVASDVGHALVAQVTATNSGGAIAASSAASTPVESSVNGLPSFVQSVDGGNSLNGVSCVSGTTDCVVSDSKGNAFYSTNVSVGSVATWTAWSGPATGTGMSSSAAVACPTTSLCLLADGGILYYATSLGGSWTQAYAPSFGVDAISCVSSSFCVTGQNGLGYFRYSTSPSSSSWVLEQQGSAAMKGVFCVSTSFCAIGDGAGSVHVATSTAQVESSSWTSTNVDGASALNGVACTSTSSCVAVDGVGNVLNLAIAESGAATATKQNIDGSNSLTAVTCTSSTCVTVDNQGNVFISTDAGKTWTGEYQLKDNLTSVSCASTTLCSTVDTTGNVTSFGTTFVQAVDSGNSLNGVSCVSGTTDCVTSDSKGNAFYSTNVSVGAAATWTAWSGPGTSPSAAVACPSTSLCLLADGGKLYYATSLGGSWTQAYAPVNGVDAIACVSSSFCVSGQNGLGYFRYSTSPSSSSWVLEQQGSAAMKGVFCVSTSFCAIGDGAGSVHVATSTAQVESSSWTSTNVDGTAALNGVACTSTSSCVAVDGAGNVLNLAIAESGAATATKQNIDGSNSLTAVTCTSSTCVTVDNQGNVFISTDAGKTWTGEYQLKDNLTSVSCASTTLCSTVDTTGHLASFNPALSAITEGEARSPQPGMTIEYGVPVSGSGAPYAMGSSDVAKWAQTDIPAEATAVFPSSEPMGWPATDYRRATVHYLDSSDRVVNAASAAGGITTSEYNSYGDEVRSLSADDREAALKEGAKSAEVAQSVDTQRTYGSEGAELLGTLGPLHTVKLASGTQVQARRRTVYNYDEGAPAGGPYRLVTKVAEGAQIAGEPEADVRTTKRSYGGQNNLGWILRAPTSTTVDPSGLKLTTTTVYDPASGHVTETRTPAAGAPNEEPLSGYVYRSTFGSLGVGNGQLSHPDAITRDSSGNLWVADMGNNRIEEFSSGGTFVQKFGTAGTGNGQLKQPKGIAVDSEGHVWVADTGNNRIEEFSTTGTYLFQFKSNTEHTEFKSPSGIAILPDHKFGGYWLLIADTGNNRVVEFYPEGYYFGTRASSGTENGKVTKPEGVALDSAGTLWVADTGNNRVQEFSGETSAFMQKFGTLGSGNGQLSKPEGLALDSEGNVLVADSGNNRIEEFSSSGAYITKFGTVGTGEQNMKTPAGIVLDSSNNAYVLDTGNNRIQNWVPASSVHESSGTGGTHGKQTIYYTVAANGQTPACGEHPEWAGLPCETTPAAQPETSGVPNLPATKVTYDMWDDVLSSTEAVGTTTRTNTDVYDEAGRLTKETVSSSVGAALPSVEVEYNSETGDATKLSTTVEGVTKSLESTYDRRGDLTSYKDADGNTSSFYYDAHSRLESINDGKGTQTYGYDATTGLVTKVVDSAAGTFTASYDVEGNLTTAGYPNGMNVNHTYDPTGSEVGVEYVKTTHCTSGCTWYSQSESPSIHGQASSQASTLSSQNYTYDAAGRLTKVQDTPASEGCTTRIYAYDEETNIDSLTTRPPGGEGKCASEGGTVVNHSYDSANRLTDAGIGYDTFGDITKLPAGDAGGSEVTSSYYVDETLASQSQNGETIGYYLDPSGRDRQIVSTGTTNSTVTYHYAGGGQAPAWTEDTAGKWTRNIYGLGGTLVAKQNGGESPVLQIEDLHGSIVGTASLSETATGLLSKGDSTEYGVPRTSSPPKYSWMGADALRTELPSGIVAMGARSYVPEIGRFLQPDPIEGGSANEYAYTYGDPVNSSDPSGEYTVATPSWVRGFLDEEAEVATEAAIQRAAEEQAAREEAEEKAREAEAEAAEAAAEAAADVAAGGGGGGKKGKKAKGKSPGKVNPGSAMMTDGGGFKGKDCKRPFSIRCGESGDPEGPKPKSKSKSECPKIEASYRPRDKAFELSSGLYYGDSRAKYVSCGYDGGDPTFPCPFPICTGGAGDVMEAWRQWPGHEPSRKPNEQPIAPPRQSIHTIRA